MVSNLIYLFLLGFFFGSGPCLVSCGPLLVSYIAGTDKGVGKSLRAYFLFSLGRIFAYAVLGLAVFLFGWVISEYVLGPVWRFIVILGAIFIIVIGLLMAFGRSFEVKICQKLQSLFLNRDAKTVFIFGVLIGILPCLPLVSLFSYIGLVSKSWMDSLAYSAVFGLGTIFSPLLILSMFAGFIPAIFRDRTKLRNIFNILCGLIVIILGIRLLLRAI